MEKSLLRPFLTVVILMGITLYALTSAVGVELNKIPGVVMNFPEQVGIWVGNELRFCHNPDACAKDYRDASFYIRDLDFPDICPNCGEGLYKCARAEKEHREDERASGLQAEVDACIRSPGRPRGLQPVAVLAAREFGRMQWWLELVGRSAVPWRLPEARYGFQPA